MDKNKTCTACNIKLDQDNFKKDRTICNNCYNKKERKNTTKIQNQLPKIDNTIHEKPKIKDFENETCHRHLIIGGSRCGKTHLTIFVLLAN